MYGSRWRDNGNGTYTLIQAQDPTLEANPEVLGINPLYIKRYNFGKD